MRRLSTLLSAFPPPGRLGRALVFGALVGGGLLPCAARADEVSQARDTLSLRHDAAVQLSVSRQALTERSEALAAEIARLKSAGTRPLLPGVPGGTLDDRLKQHQALAGQLVLLDRQYDDARAAEDAARQALAEALDRRVGELRAQAAQGDAAARRLRFETLRHLVAERRQLDAAAAAAAAVKAPATVQLPAVDPRRTDPSELSDLAVETRDHADHVRQQLTALGERLAQLQSRRRLLRSAQAFARDESLFGEDERARRVISLGADGLRPGAAVAQATERPTVDTGGPTVAVGETAGRGEPQSGGGNPSVPPPEAPGEFDGNNGQSDEASGSGESAGLGADPTPTEPTPEPPPTAYPAGTGALPGGGGVQPALIVQDVLDPQLLSADVGSLGPDALADQIRRLEARRRELEITARKLEERQRVLEREAGTSDR